MLPIDSFLQYPTDENVCAFSTKRRGMGVSKGKYSCLNVNPFCGDDPVAVAENMNLLADVLELPVSHIVLPHQVHTDKIAMIGNDFFDRNEDERKNFLDGVDVVATGLRNVCVGVSTADCVPLLLYDKGLSFVAAVHAGWRGTVGDIAGEAVKKMKSEFGSNSKDIKAVVGPSICQDCYEVNFDVAEKFINKYYSNGKYNKLEQSENRDCFNIVRPASGDFSDNPTQKYYLNLWGANKVNLINAGVESRNIEISGICTKCHSDLFYSHRAHGNERGVNIGFITIKND
jgi:YfiH family protein